MNRLEGTDAPESTQIAEALGATVPSLLSAPQPRSNIAPTQSVLGIRVEDGIRSLVTFR